MITLEQARQIAKEQNPGSDTLLEYSDAYEFYKEGFDDSEIVIMKKTGEYMTFYEYIWKYHVPFWRKILHWFRDSIWNIQDMIRYHHR